MIFCNRLLIHFRKVKLFLILASPVGVKMANIMVIKKSGMDEKFFLKLGVKSSKTIQSWDKRIIVLSEVPLFKNAKKGHNLKTKIGLLMSDIFKMQYMIHIKIKNKT